MFFLSILYVIFLFSVYFQTGICFLNFLRFFIFFFFFKFILWFYFRHTVTLSTVRESAFFQNFFSISSGIEPLTASSKLHVAIAQSIAHLENMYLIDVDFRPFHTTLVLYFNDSLIILKYYFKSNVLKTFLLCIVKSV